jgi:hypothetical protein
MDISKIKKNRRKERLQTIRPGMMPDTTRCDPAPQHCLRCDVQMIIGAQSAFCLRCLRTMAVRQFG